MRHKRYLDRLKNNIKDVFYYIFEHVYINIIKKSLNHIFEKKSVLLKNSKDE